jgi:hypothetical protein
MIRDVATLGAAVLVAVGLWAFCALAIATLG